MFTEQGWEGETGDTLHHSLLPSAPGATVINVINYQAHTDQG